MSIGLGNKPADCNAFAWRLNLSYDGRYVSFESCASNLVANDTNVKNDTFVRDRRTNRTERVSVGLGGAQALGNNSPVAQTFLSADGRFVAFSSLAYNLVPNDQPSPAGKVDTFVYDRKLHKTERVSVSSAGVAANGASYVSGISADGRFVLFATAASNLVPGDSNPDFDVFVHDRRTHQTECVSVVSGGALVDNQDILGNAISADGRYVVFGSNARELISEARNGFYDVYVHDRKTHLTELVSLNSSGENQNGYAASQSISANGRFVIIETDADNMGPNDTNATTDEFVRDRWLNRTERVTVSSAGEGANSYSYFAEISPDGRYVTYTSPASNLVPNDTNEADDVFVHDRKTHITERASVASTGEQAEGYSGPSTISPGGRYVAFNSGAVNLVPRGASGAGDVYLRVRGDDH